MKKLMLLLAASVSMSAAARSVISIEQIFLADASVQQLVNEAKANPDLIVETQPEKALLAGGCGYAGCSYSHLVTIAVRTKGVNPQTYTIAGIVSVGSLGTTVRVIDTQDVLKLEK